MILLIVRLEIKMTKKPVAISGEEVIAHIKQGQCTEEIDDPKILRLAQEEAEARNLVLAGSKIPKYISISREGARYPLADAAPSWADAINNAIDEVLSTNQIMHERAAHDGVKVHELIAMSRVQALL